MDDMELEALRRHGFGVAYRMLGSVAEAEDDAITLDVNELEDAMWVPREMVRAVLRGEEGPFVAPPPYAIAYTLLREWAGE